jgi:hypothetical protein
MLEAQEEVLLARRWREHDILWRHDSGLVITWKLDGGSIIGYHGFGTVDPIWQVQP